MNNGNLVQQSQPQFPVLDEAVLKAIVVDGNLKGLSNLQLSQYYLQLCHSLKLNPTTRPFATIDFNGKKILYALKGATDQLRQIYGLQIEIVSKELIEDLYIVEVKATTSNGRSDTDLGVVCIGNLKGDAKANAIMKAITKAKRRVTLSICGLGMLDESEIKDFPGAGKTEYIEVDPVPVPTPKPPQHDPGEMAKVKALREQIGYSTEDLVSILKEEYNVDHPAKLTKEQLQDFIKSLELELEKIKVFEVDSKEILNHEV